MPELLAHGSGFCQKKWLLHYGIDTILGSPELSRQVCLARMACILAAQAHFPGECTAKRVGPKDSGRLWCTTMVSVWAKRYILRNFLDFFPVFRHTI